MFTFFSFNFFKTSMQFGKSFPTFGYSLVTHVPSKSTHIVTFKRSPPVLHIKSHVGEKNEIHDTSEIKSRIKSIHRNKCTHRKHLNQC